MQKQTFFEREKNKVSVCCGGGMMIQINIKMSWGGIKSCEGRMWNGEGAITLHLLLLIRWNKINKVGSILLWYVVGKEGNFMNCCLNSSAFPDWIGQTVQSRHYF